MRLYFVGTSHTQKTPTCLSWTTEAAETPSSFKIDSSTKEGRAFRVAVGLVTNTLLKRKMEAFCVATTPAEARSLCLEHWLHAHGVARRDLAEAQFMIDAVVKLVEEAKASRDVP